MAGTEQAVRVGIVGGGGIAGAHVRALRAAAKEAGRPSEIVGVADVDTDRARAFVERHELNAEAYDDVSRMLTACAPDIVHICTPPGGHAEQAVTCLESGAWVLCEKPACLSLAELDRIEAAARKSGAYFSVVCQHRFGAGGKHVKRLLDDEALGRPFVGLCVTAWYRDHAYYSVPWRGNWETEGGGPTMGHGIHQMDLLAHLLGDWEEIEALAARLDRPVETEDVSLAHVRFANGSLASIVNSVLSPREESYIRIDCEKATVELRHLYGYQGSDWQVTPAREVPEDVARQWSFPEPDVPSSHTAQVVDLLASFASGEAPAASGASARRTIELITALYCSAAVGRRVHRTELTENNPFYERLNAEPSEFATTTSRKAGA